MGKKFLVGLLKGLLVGGATSYGLFVAFPSVMSGFLGYLFAALVGVLTGLIAGKPIWSKGASIEASLKAVFGAILGAGILFGLRYIPFDIPAIWEFPRADVGVHPIASLLSVAVLLSLFYEIDNTGTPTPPSRVASERVGEPMALDESDVSVAAKKKQKK